MNQKIDRTLAIFALALLVSCKRGTLPIPNDTPSPPTASLTATFFAIPSASATATSTFIPPRVTPTYSGLSNTPVATPIPGWVIYTNDYLGYRFNYPLGATLFEQGSEGMDTNEIVPAGFTYWDYYDYVMAILPDNLCVSVSFPGAFITIAPPYNPLGSYLGPCPGMGIGSGYTFVTADETISIAGREYNDYQGTKLFLESSGAFYAEFYVFELENGFRVIFNGRPTEGMTDADYLAQRALAIDSIETLHWFRIPDLTKPGTTCAGAFTKLVPGVEAMVVGAPDDPPNRVRSGPSTTEEILSQIYPQTVVKILAGPVCADGLVFWNVEIASIPGGSGWTAEGDGVEYWLEPFKP